VRIGRSLSLIVLIVALVASGLALASPAAAKVDNVLVGASGIQGVSLETFATGAIDPIAKGQDLRLSRLHFDPCTAITLHNTGGAVLIYAESSGVAYAYQGGESTPDQPLDQGDSIVAGAHDFLTIVNPMIDPAYSVDLLLLSVTEDDSFVDVPVLEAVTFGKDAACDEVNEKGTVTPTILAEGNAGVSGSILYIGSAFFYPEATTENWDIIDQGTTFNLLLLAGGMGAAGPNSGRAAWIGPGGVLHDSYNEGPIGTFPFVNTGPSPVFGLVFGTVMPNSAVFLPLG